MDDLKGMPSYGVKMNGRRVGMGMCKGDNPLEAELAAHMYRERMKHRVAAFVQHSFDEEEASRMNAAGVTIMQHMRKRLLGSAAAIWPFPHNAGNISEAA